MPSSYDPTALVPAIGSRWVWEIDQPHARELIEVVAVVWDGKEWWIGTKILLTAHPRSALLPPRSRHMNDLSRFAEAVTAVGCDARAWRRHKAKAGTPKVFEAEM